MYFVILTGTSARIAIASETEKKREASISHSNHQWPCSRENNLALLQDKLDSLKHLNEKNKIFFHEALSPSLYLGSVFGQLAWEWMGSG